MNQYNAWSSGHANESELHPLAEQLVDRAFAATRAVFVQAMVAFLAQPITPATFLIFELTLIQAVRELGRLLIESVVNSLESDNENLQPLDFHHQLDVYRRRNEKTRNSHVLTRFGRITLWRRGYRSRLAGEPSIFPLELMLGLTQGATPATVSMLGQLTASAGMSQSGVLAFAKEHFNFSLGVKRLRQITEKLSDSMAEFRQVNQVDALLAALEKADKSTGNRKPVLSVGRDGITLRQYQSRCFEVATAATVSVYDRAGKRLQTIYLGWPPELGQATMDAMLTGLLNELFSRYTGKLPRLAYVTDCGANEVGYFKNVLRKMKHPLTGKRLKWQRIVDFYHASERVWAMADQLFTKRQQPQAHAWARKMLKNLKKPNGARRVLHSAASLFHRRKLGEKRQEKFWVAYHYIQSRTKHMKYADYRNYHLSIGSGVTEAACKTIFTQRLKLSGMRWSSEGAQQIITLRTILLSKTWDATFLSHLNHSDPRKNRTYDLAA